ncbi:MAG: hypothetical protein BWY85_00549 [Firmicutes bacterium ADurb.Bin506]|jgi:hypothetical protein|nr:MAG: hypothetical protein BWY85_00549 [Firmicutes bacterium ADurb.Bin506]
MTRTPHASGLCQEQRGLVTTRPSETGRLMATVDLKLADVMMRTALQGVVRQIKDAVISG